MFHRKKKFENKEYLRNVAVYRYHTDTGRLEIFPNCILYEQTGIVPRQMFARGVTKAIDDSNMILVDNKQGKIIYRCFANTILFWLQNRDDNQAKKIIKDYISKIVQQTIHDAVQIADDARRMHDVLKLTFDGELGEIDISKEILKNQISMYVYHSKDVCA